jgi:hypothetical protein
MLRSGLPYNRLWGCYFNGECHYPSNGDRLDRSVLICGFMPVRATSSDQPLTKGSRFNRQMKSRPNEQIQKTEINEFLTM